MSGRPSAIVEKAQVFARKILEEELPEDVSYHSLEHTEFVVSAALEIGQHTGLSEEELEIVEVAAWFHDLGYRKSVQDHEETSTEMVLDFLGGEKYEDEKAARIAGCIMSTKMPQTPKTKIEEVLCDADLLHLADGNYFEKSGQLHKEVMQLKGMEIGESEWMEMNKQFIKNHTFFTAYAREKYREAKQQNLKQVKKRLKSMKKNEELDKLQEKIDKLKEKVKEAKELTPTRGIETMFRLTSKNHLELSAIADNKANIMISINALILSIMISVLFRKIEEYPHLTIPSMILTLVCLVTIVIAIIATRPNVSKGKFTRDDIKNKETNLLFFGNFHSMKLNDYEWAMKEMLKDANYLYSSLIRDIYYLGAVLGRKYRLLRLCYTVFMFGFVAAVISFVIAELFFKAPYPY
ncbi:MAG: Pycsar system effector family protein [Bacteroidota bacterium]